MGCDIHLYKEKKVNGQWVTADDWGLSNWADEGEVCKSDNYPGRNYATFGALSKGVRFEVPFGFEPRGMPFNACDKVTQEKELWGCDGHSHSYISLSELREFAEFIKTETLSVSGMKDAAGLEALQKTIDAGNPNWELLYPYCRWTNQAGHMNFELNVPADFYIGRDIEGLISLFDGMEGEDFRIVFWFDN